MQATPIVPVIARRPPSNPASFRILTNSWNDALSDGDKLSIMDSFGRGGVGSSNVPSGSGVSDTDTAFSFSCDGGGGGDAGRRSRTIVCSSVGVL